MKTPIGEVISAAHVSGLSKVKAINILSSNDKYSQCLVDRGNAVIGDVGEMANYLRAVCYEEDPELLANSGESTNEKALLFNEIEKLKHELPSGAQYYEYKTIIIQDSAFLGNTDAELIELTLNKYAMNGWRLKAAVTNELDIIKQ